MFIPPGEIVHESLATSYVLVDALCADLCEGGFSGIVEVVLRDTDSFIIISNGIVSAAIEKRNYQPEGARTETYGLTSVEGLAQRSRLERGRLSIYGYHPATASAVARRINAQPLYVGLSTEFTDLEKMISKLVREPDREWFIEVSADSGSGALIHIRDSQCRIIDSTGRTNSGALNLASNPALGFLIDECNRGGGTFDVYFTQAGAATFQALEKTSPDPLPVPSPIETPVLKEELTDPQLAGNTAAAAPTSMDLLIESRPEFLEMAAEGAVGFRSEDDEMGDVSSSAMAAAAASQPGFAPAPDTAEPALREDFVEAQHPDLSTVRDEFATAGADAETMAEIKRLMGEVARAIEEAAQSIGRPDSFSMSLRAGQLQIADRYPFLDPFAGEFEYLSGEIVFVGDATAEKFVEGLTAALKLAIEAVARTTAYAERFRSYVSEDLRKLYARERAEFERFGLDHVIEQILTGDR